MNENKLKLLQKYNFKSKHKEIKNNIIKISLKLLFFKKQ